jgi:hypothetical protein
MVKDCKVGIVVPDQIRARSRNNSLEGGSFDDTEFPAVAKAEVMAVGAVLQIGRINVCCPQLLIRQRDFLSISERLVVYCFEIG